MFFSKKKKRKRFLCLRILFFSGSKATTQFPQVMSNYLNTTKCFDLYGWHALKIQKLSNSTP